MFKKLVSDYDGNQQQFIKRVIRQLWGTVADNDLVLSSTRLSTVQDVPVVYAHSPQFQKDFIQSHSIKLKLPNMCDVKGGLEVKSQLQNVPELVLAEAITDFGPGYELQYEIGFARKCRDKVESIYFDNMNRYRQEIPASIRWEGHLYCLTTLLQKIVARNLDERPVDILKLFVTVIEKVLMTLNFIICWN